MEPIVFAGLYAKDRRLFISNLRNQPHTRIISDICYFFNISISDVKDKSRVMRVVRCRHTICFILYYNTRLTLKEIGSYLGDRDHSTIIHAIENIEYLIMYNKPFKSTIMELKKYLEHKKNYGKIHLSK